MSTRLSMITYFQTKFVCLVIIKLVIPPILSLKFSVSASVNLVWTKSFVLWQYNIFLGFLDPRELFQLWFWPQFGVKELLTDCIWQNAPQWYLKSKHLSPNKKVM